jgi:kynurenine formamidase
MNSSTDILSNLVHNLGKGSIKVVDLTHPLGPATPMIKVPEGHGKQPPAVQLDTISDYRDGGGGYARWSTLTTAEHAGTHFDTPSHWYTGQEFGDGTTDTISVDRFIAPACVIDCTTEVQDDEDFVLTADHLKSWESKYGSIPAGSWLLLHSGWAKRFDNPEKFLNQIDGVYHSPGPSPEAVRHLLDRDACGYGTETIGTDHGNASMFDPVFPAHNLMHGANKFGMSSLNNLDQLPPTGAVILTPPLKIVDGSGSPLRVLAFVPADS